MLGASIQIRCLTAPYMGDLIITITSVPESRSILQGLQRLITWARMSNRLSKSKSMVLTKGKVIEKLCVLISGTTKFEPSWDNQSRAWRSSLTPAWAIQLLFGGLLKSLEGGSPRWTRQACPVDLKLTKKPFCQELCGLYSCSPNNCPNKL